MQAQIAHWIALARVLAFQYHARDSVTLTRLALQRVFSAWPPRMVSISWQPTKIAHPFGEAVEQDGHIDHTILNFPVLAYKSNISSTFIFCSTVIPNELSIFGIAGSATCSVCCSLHHI